MSLLEKQRRLPAEWENQAGAMLVWPHADSDWAGTLDLVEPVFLSIAEEIGKRQPVLVIVQDAIKLAQIRQALTARGVLPTNLALTLTSSDDTWARDYGPITVVEAGQPRLLNFQFNGWGHKYPSARDNAVNTYLAKSAHFGHCPMESIDLVLEGGSIDSDGQGTLMTTRACLCNPNRNPGLTCEEFEQALRSNLGADRVLWLDHGCLEGDDTDGHIDMLARFVDPHTVVYQSCDETGYSCYEALYAMQKQLQTWNDAQGQAYRLIALPWPKPKFDAGGRRLPASYANFLIINSAVLMPCYGDPADTVAADLLRGCFPERQIVPIDCRQIIPQNGSLHCLTMQFPAGLEFVTDDLD